MEADFLFAYSTVPGKEKRVRVGVEAWKFTIRIDWIVGGPSLVVHCTLMDKTQRPSVHWVPTPSTLAVEGKGGYRWQRQCCFLGILPFMSQCVGCVMEAGRGTVTAQHLFSGGKPVTSYFLQFPKCQNVEQYLTNVRFGELIHIILNFNEVGYVTQVLSSAFCVCTVNLRPESFTQKSKNNPTYFLCCLSRQVITPGGILEEAPGLCSLCALC